MPSYENHILHNLKGSQIKIQICVRNYTIYSLILAPMGAKVGKINKMAIATKQGNVPLVYYMCDTIYNTCMVMLVYYICNSYTCKSCVEHL